MPSAIPTSVANATMDLSTPYIDYISAIPNLSTSLTSLGRYVSPPLTVLLLHSPIKHPY
jgi:hypothetical protein